VGNAALDNGQILETEKGKAEILLTPGVYLRIGDNSSVRMLSNGLTKTEVALDHGEAMLEVDQIYPQNNIHVGQPGADTRVLKTGLYDFDAGHREVRVLDGKAVVTADDRNITVKKDHQLALDGGNLKARELEKNQVAGNNDLYRWSSLRSEYLSEANVDSAQLFYANGWNGPGWWGPGAWGAGWYWDPWFDGFTFLPGAGFFYNPFGWGFYSPYAVWRAPYFAGVHGYQHFDGTRAAAIGRGFNHHAVTSFRGGNPGEPHAGGGFHGGVGGGGGFHAGGGFSGRR
jgi:hypothetical protein